MTAPFRDSPNAAIARLAAKPVHPIRRVLSAMIPYRAEGAAHANARLIDLAKKRGFALVGGAAEGFATFTIRKQIFVDEARTTQVHLTGETYLFVTYFESGKCVITWDHAPRTPNDEVLTSRASVGSFDADYEAHVAAVEKVAAEGAPIAVPDLPTALALGRHYYTHVVPLTAAVSTVVVIAVLPTMFLLIVFYFLIDALRVH